MSSFLKQLHSAFWEFSYKFNRRNIVLLILSIVTYQIVNNFIRNFIIQWIFRCWPKAVTGNRWSQYLGRSLPREGTSTCRKSYLPGSSLQLPGASHRLEVLPVSLLCVSTCYVLCMHVIWHFGFFVKYLIIHRLYLMQCNNLFFREIVKRKNHLMYRAKWNIHDEYFSAIRLIFFTFLTDECCIVHLNIIIHCVLYSLALSIVYHTRYIKRRINVLDDSTASIFSVI